jgi:hypothetical protein
MYEPLTEEEKQRMKARRDVVAKAITYAALVVFFFVINKVTSPVFSWWIFPALGMGIDVVKRYVRVYIQEDYSEDPQDRRKRERRERRERRRARRKGQTYLPPAKQEQEEALDLEELEKVPEKAYRNEDLV